MLEVIRRRRRRSAEVADLDVTPFMNLMIVLVPVLLLSMVFTHITVIELDFPSVSSGADSIDQETTHLEIQIYAEELVIRDQRSVLKRIATLSSGVHDFDQLSQVLKKIKQQIPRATHATILLEAQTNYQTLVSTMDRVRSYQVGVEGSSAELFPEISLGDAPIRQDT